MYFNVKEYGAVGDGTAMDTKAVQEAVDCCFNAGGGTVFFPVGVYVCGKVLLRDNVTVELGAGAEISAPIRQEDYEFAGDTDNYIDIFSVSPIKRWAVFYAYGARNIRLMGQGRIVMHDKSFFDEEVSEVPRWVRKMRDYKRWVPHDFRPFPVLFENCENIAVQDVRFCENPVYAVWMLNCSHIRIQNIHVLSDPGCINTDGIHLTSCRNVFINGCYFRCGDDCIAVDSNLDMPSENVVVSNCIFYTSVSMFRLYTGLEPPLPSPDRKTGHHDYFAKGIVRNICISNCVAEKCACGFNITADAGTIDGVYVKNITGDMNDMDSPFFIMTMDGGRIRNVNLSGIYARCTGGGVIAGDRTGAISDITLADMKYEISPTSKLYGNGMPDPILNYWTQHFAPYYLYVRHADNLKLHRIRAIWGKADIEDIFEIADPANRPSWARDGWREEMDPKTSWPFLEACDVSGLEISGLECSQFGSEAAAVQLTKVSDGLITGSRVLPGTTRAFLLVDCENIQFFGNDFTKAEMLF